MSDEVEVQDDPQEVDVSEVEETQEPDWSWAEEHGGPDGLREKLENLQKQVAESHDRNRAAREERERIEELLAQRQQYSYRDPEPQRDPFEGLDDDSRTLAETLHRQFQGTVQPLQQELAQMKYLRARDEVRREVEDELRDTRYAELDPNYRRHLSELFADRAMSDGSLNQRNLRSRLREWASDAHSSFKGAVEEQVRRRLAAKKSGEKAHVPSSSGPQRTTKTKPGKPPVGGKPSQPEPRSFLSTRGKAAADKKMDEILRSLE